MKKSTKRILKAYDVIDLLQSFIKEDENLSQTGKHEAEALLHYIELKYPKTMDNVRLFTE